MTALALDLGTTTLAGRLLGPNGAVLAEARQLNPQRARGADVIRRLEAALAGEGKELQRLLVEGLASLLDELLRQSGRPRTAIVAAAAAANPAITALLCNDDPRPILFPPHRPRQLSGRMLAPASLSLDLPVPLYLFPLVSGYVGGDLVAFLYGVDRSLPGTLLIDLGTNGELALCGPDGWLATSVAAGPAFEGGEIGAGMLVGPGAITDVVLDHDRLRLTVVGGGAPRGIAGSGLFAAIAAGLDGGLIERSGRIVAPDEVASNLSRYLVAAGEGHSLCLHRDVHGAICVTQQDVRAFQLAKGAVRAGVEALLQRAKVAPEAVTQVIVSGAFGLSLDPRALKTVAMLPPVMVEKTRFIPAGALVGVSRSLLEADGQRAVAELAGKIQSYPLSGTPLFERAFLAALDF